MLKLLLFFGLMSRRKKQYDDDDIPMGKWFPDKGDRVFVPSFNTMGTVIEICPHLRAGEVVAREIYYLVEMDEVLRGIADLSQGRVITGRGVNTTPSDYVKRETGIRSLFTAEELVNSRWVSRPVTEPLL